MDDASFSNQPARRKDEKTVISHLDVTLIMLVILLGAFGLVMIYSTSSYNSARYYNDPTLYLRKQFLFLLIGIGLMLAVSRIDYKIYIRRFTFWKITIVPVWILYLGCLVMQAVVLFMGYSAGGSLRWFQIPIVGQFQPSEISKIAVILFTAYLVQSYYKFLNGFFGFVALALRVAPVIGLVAYENLSTGIVMAGIFVVICFCASRKKWYYFLVGVIGIGLFALFVSLYSYRAERIFNWMHPENLDPGSQILQGLYAIASGGFLGKGLGESVQKLGYIPEVHTDMIFTVICEELGIVGAILVITVFLIVLWQLFRIAMNAPDLFGALVATGTFTNVALQLLINIAVVTNSIPATGIPLPFISYGGSSLCVLMIEIGLALSVSRYTTTPKEVE